jgi:hypothetical protein
VIIIVNLAEGFMKLRTVMGLLIAAGISLNVQAAIHIDMKPGLWEHRFKMDETSLNSTQKTQAEQMTKAMAEMKKQMETMPPEQRKMMEDMMAQQGIKVSDKGLEMAAQGVQITKEGTVVKACVTQEEIDRGELPKGDDNCEEKVTQISPKALKISYVCKGEHPTHGEGEVVFQNDKSYTGQVSYTTTVEEKPETYRAIQTGKWLSSDCGNIKPQSAKVK